LWYHAPRTAAGSAVSSPFTFRESSMSSRCTSVALLALSSGLALATSAMAQVQIDPADPVLRAALRRVYGLGGGMDTVGPDVIVGEIQNSGGCCPDSETVTIAP